jgi:pimeloyl-ACP methyl ester carboxylesterase
MTHDLDDENLYNKIMKVWKAISTSRQLLYRSALVLLVCIGFWNGNPQTVVQASTVNQNGDVPRFERETCYKVMRGTFSLIDWVGLSQSRFRCGYLITWKDYDLQENGGTISLAVMETYPAGEQRPAPVLWLAGGPGATGFNINPRNAINYTDQIGRGWIQFSQRGSRQFEPELLCSEYREAIINNWESLLNFREWNTIKQIALEDCRNRLRDEWSIEDYTVFNSEFNAVDVIYLIRQLGYGYGNVHLYGGSYGTLLAQHVLALSPGDIRSAVLAGVAPLGVDWEAEYALNFQNSIDLIIDACTNDCKAAYPDLERSFYSLLDQLADEPASISVRDGWKTYRKVYIDDYGFLRALGNLLADSASIKKIPRIIHEAHEIYESGGRNFDGIEELGPNYYTYQRNQRWPWGMYFSIYCTEFARFDPGNTDLSRVKPQLRVLYEDSKQLMEGACPLFESEQNSYGDTLIADRQVPILIFNGKFDPLTPPRYGEQVADTLSISDDFLFTSDISAHNSTHSDCAQRIMRDFYIAPEKPLDRDCWKDQAGPVEFEVPSEESGTPWWQDWQEKIAEAWDQLWEEIQRQIDKLLSQWWQEIQNKLDELWKNFEKWLEQLWKDFQKQLIEWLEEQLREWLNQCLPSAFLPLGALAVVWISRRRRTKRNC